MPLLRRRRRGGRLSEPIAILGNICPQVRRFTQVRFIPHEFKGRHWMIVEVGMECCSQEFVYTIDEIRDLHDKLSKWISDALKEVSE